MAKRRQSPAVGEGLLCPKSRSDGAPTLDDTIAGLVDLDANGLCLQWRNHMGGTPPAHVPRWLLLRILVYRIQAAALGGLDKETLRLFGHPKGQTAEAPDAQPFVARTPATREGAKLSPGAMLVREWDGKLERVMVLDKGFAWKGETYRSLSQIAKAVTGTNWNGHRFFGLRTGGFQALDEGKPGQPRGALTMRPETRRPRLRCAIYTRVSTEQGLEQEFNSLDNQREAAEAYVKSQAHEGWGLIRDPSLATGPR